MECPGCGRSLAEGAKFCVGCGTRIEPVAEPACPQCGAAHPADAKFCKQCGHAFVAAAAPPPAIPAGDPGATIPGYGAQSGPSTPPPAPVPPAAAAAEACPHCGTPRVPGVRFCKLCGQPFEDAIAPPPAPAAPVDEDSTVFKPVRPADAPPPAAAPTAELPGANEVAGAATSLDELLAAPPAGTAAGATPVGTPPAAAVTPPPPVRPVAPVARANSGLPGWLIGVIVAVVLIVVGGAAAFAYVKFFHHAQPAETAAETPVASAPAATDTPVNSAPIAMAPAAPAAAASQGVAAAPAGPLSGGSVAGEVATAGSAAAPAAALPPGAASVATAPAPAQTAPAVDQASQQAADLVAQGQNDYARGRYNDAVRKAKSALAAQPGNADAQALLQKATDAQQRVAAQRARERRERAQREKAEQAEAARQAAAEAARKAAVPIPRTPTPDEIYNQRAHSECHRGFFGSHCRHKIREQVCQGVKPGAPGTTVCSGKDD